jgi:hypothetical protein
MRLQENGERGYLIDPGFEPSEIISLDGGRRTLAEPD